jgi:hypothetical protein
LPSRVAGSPWQICVQILDGGEDDFVALTKDASNLLPDGMDDRGAMSFARIYQIDPGTFNQPLVKRSILMIRILPSSPSSSSPTPPCCPDSERSRARDKPPEGDNEPLAELAYQHKIYESNRDGNFELYLCNADGSTPSTSPTPRTSMSFIQSRAQTGRICFVADEGKGDAKAHIYYMNSDGGKRCRSRPRSASRAGPGRALRSPI